MRFLIFKIMGAYLGADVEQISAIIEPSQTAERKIAVFQFHEKIPFAGRRVTYASPKILVLRTEGPPCGVQIERPVDIKIVTLDAMRPLPGLVEDSMQPAAIWGVATMGNRVILLVDLYKLAADEAGP